jgi:hypothetical protein
MTERPNEFRLLAFDPGGRTGWAEFSVNFQAFSRPENKILANLNWYESGVLEGTEHEQLTVIERMVYLMHWEPMPFVPHSCVVTEDFDLVQLTGGKALLSPVRINAVVEWFCATKGVKFELQARQLRTAVTKERLKLFGFDGRWQKDEFAAMQHGITYLRRLKQRSLAAPWKLEDAQSTNAYWDCACARGSKTHDLSHPL